VIDGKKRKGLNELGLNSRSAHRDQGLPGKNRGALGDGVNVAGKAEILQIGQEVLVKELAAPEILDVLLGEVEILNIVNELLQSRHDGKAALIRYRAEKHIEIGDTILVAVFEITVAHGQLIKIAEHGHVQLFLSFHFIPQYRYVIGGPSVDKGRHGFDGQKYAHTASSPLEIRQVFPAGLSLSGHISARQNCFAPASDGFPSDFWLLSRRRAGARQGEKGKKRRKGTLAGVFALVNRW